MKTLPCGGCGEPTPTLGDVAFCRFCDMCQCGQSRGSHGGIDGHGASMIGPCQQFTWAGFRERKATTK